MIESAAVLCWLKALCSNLIQFSSIICWVFRTVQLIAEVKVQNAKTKFGKDESYGMLVEYSGLLLVFIFILNLLPLYDG